MNSDQIRKKLLVAVISIVALVTPSHGAVVSAITLGGDMSTFAFGLSQPSGIAFDADGNLYVSSYDNAPSTISRVTPEGHVSVFAMGIESPTDLAFDVNGNLYVANVNVGTVSRITPAGDVSIFASGFAGPNGLAFDANGLLYVANVGNGTISSVTPGGVVSTFVTLPAFAEPTHPIALAFASNGDLFVGTNLYGDQSIYRVNPEGTAALFATQLKNPIRLAFDNNDNLYVLENAENKISKYTMDGSKSTFASLGAYSASLEFSPRDERLYVGVEVPEPSTTVASLTGFAVLTLRRRRQ